MYTPASRGPAVPCREFGRSQCGPEQAIGRLGRQGHDTLAVVGRKCGDVDQSNRVGSERRGVGDDHSTVGVTDQKDRSRDLIDYASNVG